MLDNEMVTIGALEPNDERACGLRVAGPAALLAAKVIKLAERLGQQDRQPDRVKQKDTLDVFRLLQAVEVADFMRGFERHREDEHAAAASAEATGVLRQYGSTPQGRLAQLAAAASGDDPTIAPAFAALIAELLDAVGDRIFESEER